MGPDRLVSEATFPAFRDRWVAGDPTREAMFQAFFVEPVIRGLHARLTGGGEGDG